MDCNRVRLSGKLTGFGPLRYTPAGMPIVEFRLSHFSSQTEAGVERRIEFEIGGIAVADIAILASRIEAGSRVRMEGFLANRSAKSREIVFHTNHIELIG